ncbi:hypothetical protein ONZ45_g9648 [Pleurotus djamor]|nr:hypothetical protein ONZ45_g9648 [Pleurotus djamor]
MSQYYFPHPIDSEGWNQFKKYNQRVKILHGPKTAREKLYYAVASDRPFSVLLPNLREIHGWIDPSFLHLFAHPAIESCYVEDYRHDDEQGLDYVMDLIPLKMPHLRFLSFIEYTNDQIYQEDVNFPVLMRMLKSLPLLREIRLPAIFLTEQVSCALSQHLHLESICAHCFLYTEQDATFAISLPSLAYPSLTSMDLDISFNRAIKCFTTPFAVSTMRRISITAFDEQVVVREAQLVTLIAKNWPLLESLTIDLRASDTVYHPMTNAQSFSIVEPLLSCKHLYSLIILHPLPFQLGRSHILRLFKSLPDINHLGFGSSDWDLRLPPQPLLTMDTLSDIAAAAPQLLWLNISMSCGPTAKLNGRPNKITPFKNLRELGVCHSPIKSPLFVAHFLHRVLPSSCVVNAPDTTGSGKGHLSELGDWARMGKALRALRETPST